MRVIISAGGTGGHIYPALSIINKIKENEKNVEILYIGTTNRMEKDIIPKHNIPYYGIKIVGFSRDKMFDNIKTIRYFIKSFFEVKKVIKEFKPDVVIGVGGYVTAPVLYAASKLKIKTIIHEQNSVLGMTNKFLSKYVDMVLISFPDTKVNAKRVEYTGNPSSEEDDSLTFDKKEFGLSNDKKLALIVMGSLGSKVVNDKMKEILPKFNNKGYEVLFVTGKDYYDEFNSLKLNKNIKIVPFVDNLKRLFKKTDLIITRAGATTISEIISFKVPSILIPSPYVTDNHQYKNAMSLVDNNAAFLIEEKDLDISLVEKVDKIINDKDKLNNTKNNLALMSISNSASKIYKLIKEVISR